MPTRQVLFGLALLGATGTAWADDSKFSVAAGRSAPVAAGSGAAVPPAANPVMAAGMEMAVANGSGQGAGRLVAEPGLRGLTLQPTFAYRLNDALSIGIGARLVQGAVLRPGGAPADAPPTYLDSDTGAGLNLGLLYRLSDSTWLGLAYASGYELNLDERAGVADPVANVTRGRPETNRTIVEARAPDSVTASISHRLDSGWMLSASLGWMGWSALQRPAGEAPSPAAASVGGAHQYRDTWRLALGAEQQLGEHLHWSMGLSYDSSPLPGDQRNLDDPLPENLRLAAGLSYQMDQGVELQLGYSLIWLGEAESRQNGRTRNDGILSAEPPGSTLHVIGGGIVWRF
ncbi:OmpP1/FadL family transporter [Azorhizophilus paspali]|uniref:OmpP1/FadL family transporter n=1 Tax=Azorhizophilus paspali TaxID=69963 RepID=A0ABV6SI32_AZOPA